MHGYDFVGGDRHPNDYNGHGTHVASTIAESIDNGVGVTGIAFGAKIMPVRVLDAIGEGDSADIARGIRFAARAGVDIINLSFEFGKRVRARQIPDILDALRYARRKDVLVVGASGNDKVSAVAYPARAADVLSVGATTERGCRARYSNYGPTLDLVAPGGGRDAPIDDPSCDPLIRRQDDIVQMTFTRNVRTFGLPGGYRGTSMAAPHVSGVAALAIASGVLGSDPDPDDDRGAPEGDRARPRPARAGQHVRRRAGRRRRGHDAAAGLASGRPDDHHRAGRVVRDPVRDGAEQEPLRARHALVADDDQVGAELLGDVEDRVRGIALARPAARLDAGLARRARRPRRASRRRPRAG